MTLSVFKCYNQVLSVSTNTEKGKIHYSDFAPLGKVALLYITTFESLQQSPFMFTRCNYYRFTMFCCLMNRDTSLNLV